MKYIWCKYSSERCLYQSCRASWIDHRWTTHAPETIKRKLDFKLLWWCDHFLISFLFVKHNNGCFEKCYKDQLYYNCQQRVWIVMSIWYFSFSFSLHLQRFIGKAWQQTRDLVVGKWGSQCADNTYGDEAVKQLILFYGALQAEDFIPKLWVDRISVHNQPWY